MSGQICRAIPSLVCHRLALTKDQPPQWDAGNDLTKQKPFKWFDLKRGSFQVK